LLQVLLVKIYFQVDKNQKEHLAEKKNIY
jgi:hypothetical protein